MIQGRALHFARLDQMADRWEGAFGMANAQARPEWYGDNWPQMAVQYPLMHDFRRTRIHIHCWHRSDVESAAMWSLYQRDGRGVAIQTTWERLTGSITEARDIHGGLVEYIDYNKVVIPEGNMFDPVLRKRLSFAHENEVRLIMLTGRTAPDPTGEGQAIDLGPEPFVVPVPVDLAELVQGVHVAPDSPDWHFNLIEDVTRKYGFPFPVLQSALDTDPIS